MTVTTQSTTAARVMLEQPLGMTVSSASAQGERPVNEDRVLVGEFLPAPGEPAPSRLLALADGVGGWQHGEQAAEIAIEALRELLAAPVPTDPALALKAAYRTANDAILLAAGGEAGVMATTLVSMVARDRYLTIANIGDSRAYLVRAGRLTQVTRDHVLGAEAGADVPSGARALTAALGASPRLEQRLPSVFEITLLQEDRVVLCSDGCYLALGDADFVALASGDVSNSAERMVELAIERGSRDNVSAVVLSIHPGPELATLGAPPPSTGRPGWLLPVLVLLLLVAVGIAVFLLTQ